MKMNFSFRKKAIAAKLAHINDSIIRDLMKLPHNRKCVNCNALVTFSWSIRQCTCHILFICVHTATYIFMFNVSLHPLPIGCNVRRPRSMFVQPSPHLFVSPAVESSKYFPVPINSPVFLFMVTFFNGKKPSKVCCLNLNLIACHAAENSRIELNQYRWPLLPLRKLLPFRQVEIRFAFTFS